jgi:two-component system, chemotaxis family, chemotaxis protein CheY
MAFNVLIVDDSPAMRAFVRRVLELSGIALGICLDAANGQEALELLRSHWVDVILSDINMPTMDGAQLIKILEADESLRAIPVIVVSTDSTEQRIQTMLSLGAKGYVTKPFLPETLREQIEKVLGGVYATLWQGAP